MKIFATVVLLVIGSMELFAQPSVTGGTGVLGFNLTSYGRFRAGAYPYVAGSRELDRMTLVVAQSTNSVFDYTQDADTTSYTARVVSIPGVDSAAETMADNEYTNRPPKVKLRTTIMGWKNQSYFIVRFRLIADTVGLGGLNVGAVVIPRVGAVYGGEIVKYSGARKVAYYYRDGLASYWGFKALSPAVTGVSLLDWDVYSSDPNADAATDSIRGLMVKNTLFDSSLVSGSNGSIFTVNSGKPTFTNKGDSVTLFYAVSFGTTEAAMYAAMDSATAKYPKIATSVKQENPSTPSGFTLNQNYPNPFNPSTTITFSVGTASNVTLKVFDALGREIRSLVNKQLDAGTYSAKLNAAELSSGVYYYTLQAGTFRSVKKMLLTK